MSTALASWTFTSQARSVRRARQAARAQLAEWGLQQACEYAELLISELVTNAVRHARGLVRMSLSAADGLLRCEVEDSSPVPPSPRAASCDDEGSRGLLLVEVLSSGWGSVPTGRGKLVWFEVPVRMPAHV
ncbi:ATP-binding protein [Nonomuraea jabiensis]|uniref:Anti-sigma regulatory factor (Ser/Thr protein kinase) n=1 Tax=Nonomuraea jabiensis TaxID=882448 RepID=A0A7W9LFV9_9ACTN|nr:ATP-binding protein [Nonomuraea jabiensis]MBB5782290.1 anti-sigma regulatory factor (Ser/Thr protein kinase) [Nonomuraea jabiensis]